MPDDARPETVLVAAEQRDPGNDFVHACREFFKERGFLSARQIRALNNVTRTRPGLSMGSHWRGHDDGAYDGYDQFIGGIEG